MMASSKPARRFAGSSNQCYGTREVVLDNFDVIETARGNDCQMFGMFGPGWCCIVAACSQRGFSFLLSGFDVH
jgi:hypothetical protein